MTVDPRTPVLVGAATVSERLDDASSAPEACALMAAAARAAAADARSAGLLHRTGAVLVPRGSWAYHDPSRLVATDLGLPGAGTVLAELGVLQTTLVHRAARAIAKGGLDVALVVGGEARWRELRAGITGTPLTSTVDEGAAPDEVLRPDGPIISRGEIDAGLVTAVSHYALLENALRFADGDSVAGHAAATSELWARFNAVARTVPGAWNPGAMDATAIGAPGPGNRVLASPYHRWHCPQWNVDQAAALLLCSVEVARHHRVPEDRWVFPHVIAESNHMVPVSQRPVLHRSPGFALAGARAFALAGAGPHELAHVDLYSCFPIAVRVQATELGLDLDRPLTVTGGMTFGGGPLNSYVLHSTARMAQVLRRTRAAPASSPPSAA